MLEKRVSILFRRLAVDCKQHAKCGVANYSGTKKYVIYCFFFFWGGGGEGGPWHALFAGCCITHFHPIMLLYFDLSASYVLIPRRLPGPAARISRTPTAEAIHNLPVRLNPAKWSLEGNHVHQRVQLIKHQFHMGRDCGRGWCRIQWF